jgi:hypothetical protein
MKGSIGNIKSIAFHLRWIFMSPQERYSYLWNKTKKLGDLGYYIRNMAISNK